MYEKHVYETAIDKKAHLLYYKINFLPECVQKINSIVFRKLVTFGNLLPGKFVF